MPILTLPVVRRRTGKADIIISGNPLIPRQRWYFGTPVAFYDSAEGSQLPDVKENSCRVFNVIRPTGGGEGRTQAVVSRSGRNPEGRRA